MNTPRLRNPGPHRRIALTLDPVEVGQDYRAPGAVFSRRRVLRLLGTVLDAGALAAIDVVGVVLALYATLVARAVVLGEDVLWQVLWTAVVGWLPVIALLVLLVFLRAGLYRPRETRAGAARVFPALGLVTVALTGLAVVDADLHFRTFATAPFAGFAAMIVVASLRAAWDAAVVAGLEAAGQRRRVVAVGDEPAAHGVIAALRQGPFGRLTDIVAQVPDVEALALVIARHRPHEVVLAAEPPEEQLLHALDLCQRYEVRLRIVPSLASLIGHSATYVPGHAVPILELSPPALAGLDYAIKRAFDLVVSVLLLAMLSPVLAVAALLVRTTSSGPVIYRDRRVGAGERPFEMLKLRTMVADAASAQEGLEALNESDGALFKMRRDPRVTPVGRWLRRLSIDELPQLLNVLRGDMSLVGPRPLPMRDFERLEPWHRKRYLALPGITGLWQVSGRSDLGFDELVRLDFYYLENWSVWLDLAILTRTPLAVFGGRGAY